MLFQLDRVDINLMSLLAFELSLLAGQQIRAGNTRLRQEAIKEKSRIFLEREVTNLRTMARLAAPILLSPLALAMVLRWPSRKVRVAEWLGGSMRRASWRFSRG